MGALDGVYDTEQQFFLDKKNIYSSPLALLNQFSYHYARNADLWKR